MIVDLARFVATERPHWTALEKTLEVREEAGLPFSTPVNVYDICERLTPKVRVRFADYSMEGVYERSARPLIEISALRPLGRRAWIGCWAPRS